LCFDVVYETVAFVAKNDEGSQPKTIMYRGWETFDGRGNHTINNKYSRIDDSHHFSSHKVTEPRYNFGNELLDREATIDETNEV